MAVKNMNPFHLKAAKPWVRKGKTDMQNHTKCALKLIFLLGVSLGMNAEVASAADEAVDPLYADGAYASVMASGTGFLGNDNRLDFGYGAAVLGGMRRGSIAFEAGPTYARAHGANLFGGEVNVLMYPLKSLPGLYGLAGVGLLDINRYPNAGKNFNLTTLNVGGGYLFPLKISSYRIGLRTEAMYRLGRYNDGVLEQRPPEDPKRSERADVPASWNDIVVRIGLQIPLPLKMPAPPEPEPVNVVPVAADSDGDGVNDEKDACPNTEAGVQVEADGCPVPPPPPPCKVPAPGEKVSLSGCSEGDSIILSGVNFESGEARLTPNAKIILDGIADELVANPQINVELYGHTDSDGDDDYNQKLSEDRAAAVLEYLQDRGVDGERMTSHGLGETQPVADNATGEGRELNRRVELKVIAGGALTSAEVGQLSSSGGNMPSAPTNDEQADDVVSTEAMMQEELESSTDSASISEIAGENAMSATPSVSEDTDMTQDWDAVMPD